MAIRFVDKTGRAGKLSAHLQDALGIIDGTHTPPPGRSGVIAAQLAGSSALIQGILTDAPNRTGTLAGALGSATAAIVGSFTPPSTAPFVIATDFIDVPAGTAPAAQYIPSGLTAAHYQGEGGKGGYLTVYLMNPGLASNLGTAAGARVYIEGQEVANYRSLVKIKSCQNGDPRAIYALSCQVGSASVQALALGVAHSLSVVVNGATSNASDPWGNPLKVYLVQAPIFFVDETNGNDSNSGLITAPKQHAQAFSTSTHLCTGIVASNTTVSGGKSNGVQAGTQVVFRGGAYAYSWNDGGYGLSGNNRMISLWKCTGCDPSTTPTGGLQGVNAGYLKFCAYPGAILANAPEEPFISQTSPGVGFIFGAQTSDAQTATPYGFTGNAHFIAISGFKITISPTITDSSAAPIYCDNYADSWRVTNCDLSFPNSGPMLSAGISGNCYRSFHALNYIHDVFCDSGLQNHAIYMDGGLIYSSKNTIALNYLKNITGGSGVQFFNQEVSGTDLLGFAGHTENIVAWNLVDGVAKYCLNWGDSTISGRAYGNVLKNAGVSEVRFNTNEKVSISHYNNVLFTSRTSTHAMVLDEWNPAAGSVIEFFDNLLVVGTGGAISNWFDFNTGTPYTWKNNRYFDQTGQHTSLPTGGARSGETYGDPLVASDWTDFTPLGGSPLIGAGVAYGVFTPPAFDFALNPQPRAGQVSPSIGAYA